MFGRLKVNRYNPCRKDQSPFLDRADWRHDGQSKIIVTKWTAMKGGDDLQQLMQWNLKEPDVTKISG